MAIHVCAVCTMAAGRIAPVAACVHSRHMAARMAAAAHPGERAANIVPPTPRVIDRCAQGFSATILDFKRPSNSHRLQVQHVHYIGVLSSGAWIGLCKNAQSYANTCISDCGIFSQTSQQGKIQAHLCMHVLHPRSHVLHPASSLGLPGPRVQGRATRGQASLQAPCSGPSVSA